ncbi:MAG: TlpA disulfide reductase family protein [Bacteroidota bacterium]
MKQVLTILTLALMLASCQKKANRSDYVINGEAKDVYNGIRVYLKELDKNGRQIVKDTAIVVDEKFTFNGSVTEPGLHYLSVNGVPGTLPLMIENAEMSLSIDKKILANSALTGSDSHDLMTDFNAKIKDFRQNLQKVSNDYSDAKFVRDTANIATYSQQLKTMNEELLNYPIEFIKANSDSYVALNIFESQLRLRGAELDMLIETYDGLSDGLKASTKGTEIKQKLDALKEKLEKDKVTQVGAVAPSFSAPGTDGKMISLDDVKGKVTIIDFWAAWCGPCRRENPNVVRVYEKYHDQGLEIIGISLDGRRDQMNPKASWLKAIEDDKLTWHQVSNLNYFNGPVAQAYNITSIPATLILDESGTIVAKNLRGIALEQKIAELLSKS